MRLPFEWATSIVVQGHKRRARVPHFGDPLANVLQQGIAGTAKPERLTYRGTIIFRCVFLQSLDFQFSSRKEVEKYDSYGISTFVANG
jgi:hypothetical protein